MQEKKRKKKKSTAEQEEQTKKIQSVAETASEQPTAKELPKESVELPSKSNPTASGSADTKGKRQTGWILAEVAICCPVGCHAADAAASIFGQLDRSQHDVRQHLARG